MFDRLLIRNTKAHFMMKLSTKVLSLDNLITSIVALLMLLGVMLVLSCKKEPVEEVNISYLGITNASPTVGTYNLYMNDRKVKDAALPFGGNIPYFQLNSASYKVKLTTESSPESLLSKDIVLEKDKIYSLFIVGKGAGLDYLLTNDDVRQLSVEKAYIRFINLTPDAPALSLVAKDSAALVSDKTYKAASEFIEINPKVYTLEIKDKLTGGTINKELTNVDIKKGKFYTVISKGLLTPLDTEQPFGGLVISN
ncbi:MAG: DUF4397 domain-containing protein [Sphingobacteriales bacterium]|nr:MAG: DUF4397 domain-containing protein [Sphingobacteriales bacterium]